MSELKVLDIGDCLIRDHGARIILPAISKLPLKKLDLGFNELSGQIGCDALELIRSMKSFETLILDGNEFGDTWIEKIKELKQHKDFEFFSISIKEDEGISDVSELELVEALEKTNL
ncbi:hypothetical protein RF11_01806 [Thelohanellus kitauei]|uniref:Uncharacterized protein n=1 Tax=Thelohanellus kitauei TaxID=669202 RepID=A0A0C2NJG1_THEKT|nr:hypothetical protein RF11_01806 [Thelohanellus kitauei]